ncbi:MAG: immune inhibitor A [candidate division KSB1 bacterium]|nr:immune inhibitor A [candidate division KSB1 bacterium]MDZ7275698.1 immune inhibitor A [candidate division KSB1 bacterium]MDZ7284611.1 immune inhibitor A [candidate division KSB1 bacterium]MDZ7297970.1 immune inhibitor A [candidate division KSB1 bacterium]MDZ7305862.1 immune inhibitor A [candidate division KSB1 bacterium]
MHRKSIVLLVTVFLCGLGLLAAHEAGRKNPDAKAAPIQLVSKKNLDRFLMKPIRIDEAASARKPNRQQTAAAQDVIFFDDFEGGKDPWQASATWGIRTKGSGHADEDRSDWEVAKTNFHSASTSWHETTVTAISTDLLLSPSVTIPTQTSGGAPLARLNLDFWADWDAALPANRLYVYVGLDTALWHFSTTAPGAGNSSWVIENPGTAPYDVFSRQFLTTPEIDLTGATPPIELTFLYKSISEVDFDYNKVDVFTKDDDFVSYRSVASFDGPDGSPGGGTAAWKLHTVNLDAYAGKIIKIRFSENGDYGFVEPGAIFALDDIKLTAGGNTVFSDDGGESGTSTMVATGFAAGDQVAAYAGAANPNPNWVNVAVPGNVLLSGASGTLKPGDKIRIGILFGYDPTGATTTPAPVGRGLYIDDVNLTGQTIQDDVAAVNVDIPFPIKVGDAVSFTLNVTNGGSNPQSNLQWQGSILNAAGQVVASVVGRRTDALAPGASAGIPSVNTWTPTAPGIYRIRAFTRLATDEDRSNDTTAVATDDPNGFGDARYSPFVVHDGQVLFSSALWNAPASPTPAQLLSRGFQVNSTRSDPGVVTWQTTNAALVPAVNLGGAAYKGAYIQFDSLGRPQDEDLIIPYLDFSAVTSTAWLTFKSIGVGGFGFTRFSVDVSNNGGLSWNTVAQRVRGVDPETGQNFGGPAFFTLNLRPAVLNITRWAAGYSNVWIRFRYEGIDDADWTIWNVAVSGKGIQAATLSSVTDIPNDQGKQVRVSWTRSPNDGGVAGVPITHYGVWRKISGAGQKPVGGVIEVADRLTMIGRDITTLKAGTRFYDVNSATGWDFIAMVTAHSDPDYNYVAPTLADSVQTCFMVSAHTANPLVFANSNEACGISSDNLPPNAPLLSGEVQSGAVRLSWTEPDNEEPASYSVYRRLASEPSFGAAIATVTGREYQDTNIERNTSYVYAVTAKDYANNVSAFSNEVPVVTTAVADRPGNALPTEYALGNNYPNPFNPQTTIAFALPQSGRVVLTILNSLGQEIERLVDADMQAGFHKVVWEAKGRTSGVYFYRLTVNDFTQMKKMVLMK